LNHKHSPLFKKKGKWKQFNNSLVLDCQKCSNYWNRAKAVVHNCFSGAVTSASQVKENYIFLEKFKDCTIGNLKETKTKIKEYLDMI